MRALLPVLLFVAAGCSGEGSGADAGDATLPGTTSATSSTSGSGNTGTGSSGSATTPTTADPCEGMPADTAAVVASTPYTTIQAALESSDQGTVQVCAGTWAEDLIVNGGGAEFRLVGAGMDATIISGTGAGPVLTVGSAGPLFVEDLTLTGGVGTNGGGIAALNADALALTRVRLSANQAEFGGGLLVGAGGATLTAVELVDNTATETGGGLYLTGSSTLSDVTIDGNTAQQGAGVALVSEDAAHTQTWSGVVVSNNRAGFPDRMDAYGGGIYLVDAVVSADDTVEVSSNQSDRGGGLFLRNSTWSGGTISGNTAEEGGGIYLSSTGLSSRVDAVVITANTATVSGAGISIRSEAAVLSGALITENTSEDRAGGVYAAGLGTLDLMGCEVSGNTAAERGGGVYLHTDVVFTAEELVLAGNDALRGAGAYVNATGAQLVMQGGDVSQNGSPDTVSGGGVRVQLGSYEAVDVAFGQLADSNQPDDLYLGESFESLTGLGAGVSLACDAYACL